MNTKKRREGLRTWIEVDQNAIKHNFNVFRKLIPKRTKLMAVVKSNAYGHGLVDFSREAVKLGADWLGVDSIVEALALRREGIATPILVLGYTLPEMIPAAAKEDISLTVSNFEMLEGLLGSSTPKSIWELNSQTATKPLKIHIKVDTGMHRQGFLVGELPKILGELRVKSAKFKVEGLYTHFAAAKNPSFPADTKAQIAEFKKWITAFKKIGLRPLVHAAATAGTMLFPESHYDCVRIGIGLYGLWPERAVKEYLKDRITLKPALIWKSLITEIKVLPKGSRIGYDLTEALTCDGVVAVVPIGYWHGYPRALSSIGRVLVRGKECKVLGRVSMDMLTIDVTEVRGVTVGDEVTIIGPDDSSPASAEGIASLTDASWYEVVTRLNPLIKRIYT